MQDTNGLSPEEGIAVKTVTVLLIMIALVVGVAVSGSRASPVARPSAVMYRCLVSPEGGTSSLCQPITRAISAGLERELENDYFANDVGGDTFGADNSDPEARWAFVVRAIAVLAEALADWMDQRTYGIEASQPATLAWVDELFDASF